MPFYVLAKKEKDKISSKIDKFLIIKFEIEVIKIFLPSPYKLFK
jgi:hypothetical protein